MKTMSRRARIEIMLRSVLWLAFRAACTASPVFALGCSTGDLDRFAASVDETPASAAAERGLASQYDVPRLDRGADIRAAHLATLFSEAQSDSQYIVWRRGETLRARGQDDRLAADFDERGATLRPGDGEDWYARFEATAVRCGAASQ